MALLSEAKRKELFKELGLGEYNKANILKLQKKYLLRKSEWDGIYGNNTDNLLRHLKAVKDCCKNFAPEEFRCGCGGRHCSGYPTWMKPVELKNIQSIRTHYGKSMIVTCGLRCTKYNREVGGITKSEHLYGLAVDYYIAGVTDTLANRKKSIQWISRLPNHAYTYGNGIYVSTTDGTIKTGYKSAPGMGNALHTESKEETPTPTPTPAGKLTVDGVGGTTTVKRMQQFFDTTQDGVITGQNSALKKYYPSLKSVSYEGSGSAVIKKLQKWVGVTQDGILGQATVKAWQKKIGVTADGVFGMGSMKTWQTYLNNHDKPDYPPSPTPAKSTIVIDVSNFQSDINWTKVKADGIKGVIVKCGFRGAGSGKLNADTMFLKHIKGAHAAGLAVGIYMFTEAINEKEGREEADYAIKQWESAGVPIYFPIAVDTENVFYEENGKVVAGRANDTKLSKAKRTAAIKAFCEQIKAKGHKPMIYASLSWLNNQLDMSKLPYDVWVAQYNTTCNYKGKYIIWQYSSSGKVAGAKGDIDMNKCYIEPKKVNPPKSDEKKGYTGKFPSYKLVKTNAEVIADAVEWAKRIAKNNNFHYGHGEHAHHNGCYYCGTQRLKKGHGIKEYETTYCCNPFIGAAWAHGGGDATAYKMCHNCNSWDFGTDKGSYHTSKLFDKVSLKSIKAGDVLCSNGHVALYIGNGKVVQAGHEDDNVIKSDDWNDSIAIGTWDGYKRAYRYNGSVNANRPLSKGELSDRVADLQKFLVWYGADISVTRFFNEETFKALKAFQQENGLVDDGIAGEATIAKMKTIKK